MSRSTSTTIKGSLVAVELEMLRFTLEIPFNLYIRHGDNGKIKLFRHQDYPITKSDIDRLVARGVLALYLSPADSRAFSHYLLEQIVRDESISQEVRYQVLWKAARIMLSDSLERRDLDQIVLDTHVLSIQLVNTIGQDDIGRSDLFHPMACDNSLCTHMINVSTHALRLAWGLGIEDRDPLSRIGQGAMLHDIGKLGIPSSNLVTSKQLSPDKAAQRNQHPTLGFRVLSEREDLDWGILMMVYQHHEKCNGQGYPVNLPDREIHDWAKLCAVANTFEVFTRELLTHEHRDQQAELLEPVCKSLELLGVRRELDEEMVHCLTKILRNPS